MGAGSVPFETVIFVWIGIVLVLVIMFWLWGYSSDSRPEDDRRGKFHR